VEVLGNLPAIVALGMLASAALAAMFAAGSSAVRHGGDLRPSSPASAPRPDKWIVIGMGGGTSMHTPVVSPADPKRILVRNYLSNFYVSLDAGESWRMINLRGEVYLLAWDPIDPNVAYVGGVGFYRTADGCRTWELVHPDPSRVSLIVDVGDHAETAIIRKDGRNDAVEALAIDPDDTRILYAVISSSGEFVFHVSTDWGKTWTPEAALPWGQWIRTLASGGRRLYVDPRSPRKSRTIYAIGDCQVSVREKGAWKHHYPPSDIQAFVETCAGFPKAPGRPIVYAISQMTKKGRTISGGVSVSTDGGESWRTGNASIVRWTGKSGVMPNLRAVATSVNDANVAYLSVDHLHMDGQSDLVYGIARTADAGRTWELKIRETDPAPSPRVEDAWMNQYYGPEWGENPVSMCVSPSDPNTLYTTDFGRVMRSVDGLETLEAVYSKPFSDKTFTTTGIDVTTYFGVHFDPFDARHLLISQTSLGVFHSYDGGTSWMKSADPRSWNSTTYWVVFDPDIRGRAWAATASIQDLPRPKMWRGEGTTHFNGVVATSRDGGMTWVTSSLGMSPTAVTHVILDPSSPPGARVLYAAGFGTGVWKSEDGGKNWVLRNRGVKGSAPFAWRLVDDGWGVLYLVVARRSEDGTLGNDGDGALYRSTDRADTWQVVPLPDGVNGPNGLAVDPDDPRRLYLAAWGLYRETGDIGGGIYLSTDGGVSWNNVESRHQHVYDITVDPRNTQVLYATGFNSSVLRSNDKGETWARIKGFNCKWAHRVVCDPRDPERIFVTTFGGGIWYGPATGDPEALEDIVTPVMRYT